MTADQPVRVQHTRTRGGAPLAVVDLPGTGAELGPEDLRALAAVLLRAADDCETLSKRARRYGPARREYPLQPTEGSR